MSTTISARACAPGQALPLGGSVEVGAEFTQEAAQ
jgi:hypothetical protein